MQEKQMRAVIYCRCSTEEEAQKSALQQQVRESRESVERQGWLLVDEYIESASGTSVRKRNEYQRLYDDMASDKFDIIQIKSQDRLMRNTKDWYLFLDRLVTHGKKLFIYIENKFYSTDDSLLTGIKAILAENYSRELSVKLNNAHKQRQKQGKVFILPPDTRGYRKLSKYEVIIEENEAEAIRSMFLMAIEGKGSRTCAWVLRQQEKKDRRGKYYDEQSIRRIIRNPLYCGTVVQNKVHYNFDTKKYESVPQDRWVIHENAVPAIVSKEIWIAANAAMDGRVCPGKKKECDCSQDETDRRGKNNGKFDLSGKVVCGLCGCHYNRSFRRSYKEQMQIVEWKCSTYLKYGRKSEHSTRPQIYKVQANQEKKGCENIHLDERRLYDLLNGICEEYSDEYRENAKRLIDKTVFILQKVFDQNKSQKKLEKLNKEIHHLKLMESRLLDKLLQSVISDADFKIKKAEIEEKIQALSEEAQTLCSTQSAKSAMEQRLNCIRECLEKDVVQKATVMELLEQIDRIVVYPDHLEVYFRMGFAEEIKEAGRFEGILDDIENEFKITVPVDERISHQVQKKKALDDVVSFIRDNPQITAKQIAAIQGISLSAANGRLSRLKKAGRIRFDGKGGKGKWEILE